MARTSIALAVAVATLAFATVAFAGKLDYTLCTGSDAQTGSIKLLESPNFSDYADVLLKRGSTYTFKMTWTATKASASMGPKIYGIIGNIPVPWNGVEKNICSQLVGPNKCPVQVGKEYVYETSIEVLTSYPATSLVFQWAVEGQTAAGVKEHNQVCFKMPAKIQ